MLAAQREHGMALEIIGAGFARTGTESMKRALELLGFGPCYHMYEVLADKGRFDHWLGVCNDGADPRWDDTFAGYRATVDWPAAHYWRQLAAHFPEARILLTLRESECWYASMDRTVLRLMRDPVANPHMAQALRRAVFGGEIDDRAHVIATYERHNAEVRAAFGPDRLLTCELGSGWQPLCDFLRVPVPQAPYPSGNRAEEFHRREKALGAIRAEGGGA